MLLGKVIARVVSEAKLDSIPKRQLLLIEPEGGFSEKAPLIAIDAVQAGPGDRVLVMQEGSGARQAVLTDPKQPMPAQAVVIAIVDHVDIV